LLELGRSSGADFCAEVLLLPDAFTGKVNLILGLGLGGPTLELGGRSLRAGVPFGFSGFSCNPEVRRLLDLFLSPPNEL
jgi:hypothetical protein